MFSHVDDSGAARMVDVSGKDVTVRTAAARGRVEVSAEVVTLLRGEGVPKGDVLAVARIAGIQAAKRTPDLVPLCHPLAIEAVTVDLEVSDTSVDILAEVRTTGRTGVATAPPATDRIAVTAIAHRWVIVVTAAIVVAPSGGSRAGPVRTSRRRPRCRSAPSPSACDRARSTAPRC